MSDLKLYSQIKADGTDTERQHLQGPRKLQHEGLCHVLTNDHYMGSVFFIMGKNRAIQGQSTKCKSERERN